MLVTRVSNAEQCGSESVEGGGEYRILKRWEILEHRRVSPLGSEEYQLVSKEEQDGDENNQTDQSTGRTTDASPRHDALGVRWRK